MNIIKDENTDLKFLKIFAFGSVAYLLSHYFLFKSQSQNITQIRMYLYLILIADLASIYYMTYHYKPTEDVDDAEEVNEIVDEKQQIFKEIKNKKQEEQKPELVENVSENNDTQIPVFEQK